MFPFEVDGWRRLWALILWFEGYHFCLLGVGLGLLICLVFIVFSTYSFLPNVKR